MGLFKKKKNTPSIPQIPSFPQTERTFQDSVFAGTISNLPSLPENAKQIDNQNMIKYALEDSSEKKGDYSGGVISPPNQDLQKEFNSSKRFSPPNEVSDKKVFQGVNDNVFIKFDKYSSARDDMKEVQSYMKSIGALLVEINRVKAREVDEILELEKDIEAIKQRFDSIDGKIFNKI